MTITRKIKIGKIWNFIWKINFQIFPIIYFSRYDLFSTQNMINFRWIFTITREKKSEFFFSRFSFVSERFSTIWTKNQNRGGEGGRISISRTGPRNCLWIFQWHKMNNFHYVFHFWSFYIFVFSQNTLIDT